MYSSMIAACRRWVAGTSLFSCGTTFPVWLLLCLTLVTVPAFGRTVRGVVRDHTGTPVSGAAVRLKNSATLRIRSARSLNDGRYRFSGLDPRMDYELRASHKGRSSAWVRLSRFDEGEERVVDLSIR